MESNEIDNAKEQVKSILEPTKETELLQSFVRVGTNDEEDEEAPKPRLSRRHPVNKSSEDDDNASSTAGEKKETFESLKKRIDKKFKKRARRAEEFYTDKDRAAAVVMGSKDIKQSLSLKVKQDRLKNLHIPMEADAGTLLALSRSEIRAGRVKEALDFVNKAMEFNPNDKHTYVERSKCHLMLGDLKAALDDAEQALKLDENFVKAIYQKAEALYFSGDFEHSLMFYHRGLKIRPDLEEFRLGIQKAQDAIESTIGATNLKKMNKSKDKRQIKSAAVNRPQSAVNQIRIDKLYLENLLKNPNLCVANRKNEAVVKQAEEALKFLKNREGFWKQQRTSTNKPI